MKHFSLLVVFIFLCGFSRAQISEHEAVLKSVSKIENSNKKIFIALNTGLAFAGGNDQVMNGYTFGMHFEVSGKYFVFPHLAIMAKIADDMCIGDNQQTASQHTDAYVGTYNFTQYLAGLCLAAGSSMSKSQFNFIILGGFATSTLPYYELNNSGAPIREEIPANGQGVCNYTGIEFTHLKRPFGFNIGVGVFYSAMFYQNYSTLVYNYYWNNGYSSVTNWKPTTIYTNIFQIHAGITFGG